MNKTFLFCGLPGAGKDTQALLLKERFPSIEIIGSGEMFRELFADKDEIGIEAHNYWGKGLLVPDDVTFRLLERWLQRFDQSAVWILVGVVRRVKQIDMLDSLLAKFDRKLSKVYYFSVTDEELVKRVSNRLICPKCGASYHKIYNPPKRKWYCDFDGTKLVRREDDAPDKVRARLQESHKFSDKIMESYRERGLLIEINAMQSIKDVSNEVLRNFKV